ncbi:MAG: type IV pilus biogenesis/stability protein PilW [Porticoccus sp.]|nr:type IV pilus biogenesis/stability protein PilW [Porticoccus sp.]|tara:strand:+ start:28320 stop:29108 length:789 start_codon:yes stop_codon:yes gene_type:complete
MRMKRKLSSVFFIVGLLAVLLSVGCSTTKTGTDVDKQRVLENRLDLAMGYLTRGDHERTRFHLNKAMEVDSSSPAVHDAWALLYQQEKEFEEAESHFRKALSYDPTFTRGRNNYGMFLLNMDRFEDAYDQFLKGSEDLGYPRRAELFLKVGVTALQLNKVSEAEAAFEKALDLDSRMSLAHIELADLAFRRGDYQRAQQRLNQYNSTRNSPTPRGLWLGVRLADKLGNSDAEASQGLALRNLYPDSRENQQYKNWLNNEQKP